VILVSLREHFTLRAFPAFFLNLNFLELVIATSALTVEVRKSFKRLANNEAIVIEAVVPRFNFAQTGYWGSISILN